MDLTNPIINLTINFACIPLLELNPLLSLDSGVSFAAWSIAFITPLAASLFSTSAVFFF